MLPHFCSTAAQARIKSAALESEFRRACIAPASGHVKKAGWLPDILKAAADHCPGCLRTFPEGEPLPGMNMCEMCERYGAPKNASLSAALRRARNVTHTDPTPAQAAAGNYAKGELQIKGITIKLENPKGTTRRGYNADGSVKWSRIMTADYGYFANTKAVDGDAVDCFLGPDLDSDLVVAIDQYRGDTFDETKFVLGVTTQEQGEKLYLAHYPKGWTLGPVSTTTVPQLKTWLKEGDTHKPFKGQMVKAAKDYGVLLRKLRLRKGECPECGTPDQPPYPPCACGTGQVPPR